MTRAKRRRLTVMLIAGVSLTLLVMGADSAGWLSTLEDWLYDQRARHCQFFLRAPSDQVVHVDINDNALRTRGANEEIGSWPWPRSVVADLIDEIPHAGAKVIVLDTLFSEPQRKEIERISEGRYV